MNLINIPLSKAESSIELFSVVFAGIKSEIFKSSKQFELEAANWFDNDSFFTSLEAGSNGKDILQSISIPFIVIFDDSFNNSKLVISFWSFFELVDKGGINDCRLEICLLEEGKNIGFSIWKKLFFKLIDWSDKFKGVQFGALNEFKVKGEIKQDEFGVKLWFVSTEVRIGILILVGKWEADRCVSKLV